MNCTGTGVQSIYVFDKKIAFSPVPNINLLTKVYVKNKKTKKLKIRVSLILLNFIKRAVQ